MTDRNETHPSQLMVVNAIGAEFQRALERERRGYFRRGPLPRSRRALGVALVGAILAATAAGAASGVLEVGSVLPGGAPTGSGERADETVVATGTAPVAGGWRMTSYTSKEDTHDGTIVEPAGLPCIRLMLNDQSRSPLAGSGWCAELQDEFHMASVPVADLEGRAEVILFGVAPENASGVELTASGGERLRAHIYEGPNDFPGDLWTLVASPNLSDAQVDWLDENGKASGAAREASTELERGIALKQAVERTAAPRE